jgi:hypothetical protein
MGLRETGYENRKWVELGKDLGQWLASYICISRYMFSLNGQSKLGMQTVQSGLYVFG